MALKTKHFDIAEHLNTPEEIRDFLEEIANTGNDSDLIHALNTAARAVGMTEIAKKAGVTRASLYKSLSGNGNPSYSTISNVTKAFGCRLGIQSTM